MKALRALFVIGYGILVWPLLAISIIIMNVIGIVHCVWYHRGLVKMMRIDKELFEGLRLGVEQVVYWIILGKDYYVFLKEEGLD